MSTAICGGQWFVESNHVDKMNIEERGGLFGGDVPIAWARPRSACPGKRTKLGGRFFFVSYYQIATLPPTPTWGALW